MAQIDQTISSKAAAGLQAIELFINREVAPVVAAIRNFLNDRFGDDVAVSQDYTIQRGDQFILVDCSAGNRNVYFPSAVGWKREIVVVQVDTSVNSVTGWAFPGEALMLGGTAVPSLVIGTYVAGPGPLFRWRPAFGSFYRVG